MGIIAHTTRNALFADCLEVYRVQNHEHSTNNFLPTVTPVEQRHSATILFVECKTLSIHYSRQSQIFRVLLKLCRVSMTLCKDSVLVVDDSNIITDSKSIGTNII